MSRLGPRYVTVAALRAEGLDPANEFTDAHIASRVAHASRMIETWTGRWFYARPGQYRIDGTGQGIVPVPDPIVSISTVHVICGSGTPVLVEPECYVVYNRHLSQGFIGSGDRDQPAIQFVSDWYGNRYPVGGFYSSDAYYTDRTAWPQGAQTVLLAGRFGLTDPAQACVTSVVEPFDLVSSDQLTISVDGAADTVVTFGVSDIAVPGVATAAEVVTAVSNAGITDLVADVLDGKVVLASATFGAMSSIQVTETTTAPGPVLGFATGLVSNPDGVVPDPITRAVMLMVVRDLYPLGERDDRWMEQNRHRLTEMRTRDQTVRFGSAVSGLEHQSVGMWTGDPEIDNIISTYVRPPSVTFVGGVDTALSPRPGTLSHLGGYRTRVW